jgi:hypothetical protein
MLTAPVTLTDTESRIIQDITKSTGKTLDDVMHEASDCPASSKIVCEYRKELTVLPLIDCTKYSENCRGMKHEARLSQVWCRRECSVCCR